MQSAQAVEISGAIASTVVCGRRISWHSGIRALNTDFFTPERRQRRNSSRLRRHSTMGGCPWRGTSCAQGSTSSSRTSNPRQSGFCESDAARAAQTQSQGHAASYCSDSSAVLWRYSVEPVCQFHAVAPSIFFTRATSIPAFFCEVRLPHVLSRPNADVTLRYMGETHFMRRSTRVLALLAFVRS